MQQQTTRETLLTREQAAEYLNVSAGTLSVWASTRRYNLPYVKIGRCARYRVADLDKFIHDNIVESAPVDA